MDGLWWWFLATTLAFITKGLCGFANTMVFNTVLSFSQPNINISPVELLISYPASIVLVWRGYKLIDWKFCIKLISLVLIGSIPGIFFLKYVDATVIKLIFGVVILLIGLDMSRQEFGARAYSQSQSTFGIIGIISGLLCGLYGIGILMGAYVSRITKSNEAFKANFSLVVLAENTLRVFLYSSLGIITFETIKQVLILMPVMLIALFIGIYYSRAVNEKLVRKIIVLMLLFSGASLVVNSYLNWI